MNCDGNIIYINGYPQTYNDSQEQLKKKLQSYFSKYGPLKRIHISYGCVTIEYIDRKDAQDAYKGTDINRLFLIKEVTSSILISGVFPQCDKNELREIFGRYGFIKLIIIGQKYSIIDYYDQRDAKDAIQFMNGTIINDNKVVVKQF